MKKLMCLILILALIVPTLSSCARMRRRRAERQSASTTTEPDFNPDNGPGYVITDGAQPGAELGDAMPTPDPVETLTPEAIELERRQQSFDAEAASEGGDPVETPEPTQDAEREITDADIEALTNPATDGLVMGTYDESADVVTHDEPARIDATSYQYNAVLDDNIDYTFNYPSQWENVPGIYTVCFREKVESGNFPARVAITRKRLVHTPEGREVLEQLVSYMKSVATQYDRTTFKTSTPRGDDSFMGKQAYSNTYLAYWGDVEVKGFVIGCAIERTLYVLHFCASYSDYVALTDVRNYIVRSVRQKTSS